MARCDHEVRALEGLGLDDVQVDDALTHLLAFVAANARTATDPRAAQLDSAMSDQGWWDVNAPLLERVLDPAACPVAARFGTAADEAHDSAHDREHAYAFGVHLDLRGLAALKQVGRWRSVTDGPPARSARWAAIHR